MERAQCVRCYPGHEGQKDEEAVVSGLTHQVEEIKSSRWSHSQL